MQQLGREEIQQRSDHEKAVSSTACQPITPDKAGADSPDVDFSSFAHYETTVRPLTPHKEVVCRLPVRGQLLPASSRSTVANHCQGACRGVGGEQMGELRI